MKLLVTGATGMLGRDLVPILEGEGHEVVATSSSALDVRNAERVRDVLEAEAPEAVIHCAAYTNVDGAEADAEAAFAINGAGTQNLALACQALDIPLLYVSTDYVFDGKLGRPYLEVDSPSPLGVYGQSKLAGEQHVQQLLRKFYIVRTSWLYGRHGKNFVDTMRRLGREKSELSVVADQHGSPTWTVDLAWAIARLIASNRYGIYHATGQGVTTWHAFTQKILALDDLQTPVHAITTAELGRPAPRPAYSPLANLNLKLAGLPALPAWEESLETYMKEA